MVSMDNILIIETQRLIIRPLTLAAETAYYGWTGDSEVTKYVSWLPHHSFEDTIDWLKEVDWNQVITVDTDRIHMLCSPFLLMEIYTFGGNVKCVFMKQQSVS